MERMNRDSSADVGAVVNKGNCLVGSDTLYSYLTLLHGLSPHSSGIPRLEGTYL